MSGEDFNFAEEWAKYEHLDMVRQLSEYNLGLIAAQTEGEDA